jgi:hypothetical protein
MVANQRCLKDDNGSKPKAFAKKGMKVGMKGGKV